MVFLFINGLIYFFIKVRQYLLDDVSEFLSTKLVEVKGEGEAIVEAGGCISVLRAFIDYMSEREKENFRARRKDNESSVTLTTIHQVILSHLINSKWFGLNLMVV